MNENLFKVIANNWKSIPVVVRILLISIISSAIILSFFFIPTSSLKKVPLIQDSISDEVRNNIISLLQKEQIPFSVSGGRIYVDVKDKDKALFKLYTENIIPEGPDLYKWVFEMDISETREKRNLKWQTTMKKRLEQMISKMDNIEWAKVEFTQISYGPFFEEIQQEPKVSILLKLNQDVSLTRNQALAIAKLASFALGNVDPKNVTIIDTKQRLYTIPDVKEALTSEQLQYKLAFEEAIEKKVYDFLSGFLTFVRVKASVSIDWKSSYIKKSGVDPERQVVVREEKELNRGSKSEAAGVPGVISKLPAEEVESVPVSQNISSQKELLQRVAGEQEMVENYPAGTIKDLTLAVVVQKSEIINVFADPAKVRKEQDAIVIAQRQLLETLSKGVNIPPEKIVITPVNLAPAKEYEGAVVKEKEVVEKKFPSGILLGVMIFMIIVIVSGIFAIMNRKKVLLEQRLQELAREIQKKETEVAVVGIEEEPLIKEIKSIAKANPQVATLIVKQWLRGK